MSKTLLTIGVLLAPALGACTTYVKEEEQLLYYCAINGGPIDSTVGYRTDAPKQFWESYLELYETDNPLQGDSVFYSLEAQHLVAPHQGEPSKGGRYISGRLLDAAHPVWAGWKPFAHGAHTDVHMVVAGIKVGPARSITKYSVLAIGTHDEPGSWEDALRRSGLLACERAVPPAVSDASGVCAISFGSDGRATVGCS